MKPEKIIKFINSIEEKFPVDRWVIDGVCFWPLLRIHLMLELDDYIIKQREQNKRNFFETDIIKNLYQMAYGLPKYGYSCLTDHFHNDSPNHKADTVFLSQSINRMFSVKGKHYDIFCDPIVDLLKNRGVSSFFIETPANNQYRLPRYGKSMIIYPQHILWELSSIINKKKPDFPEQKTFDEFKGFLDSSGFYPEGFPANSIYKKVRLLRLRADYFKSLFKIIRPSLGLQVEYYSNLGLAFNLACREFGIPSVDIQHGVENHAAYIQWRRIPKGGYPLLPNYFWVWGKEEENFVADWNDPVSNVHAPLPGGNVLLETFLDGKNDMVAYFDQQINAINKRKDVGFHVLLTLQPDRTVPRIVIEAMKNLPTSFFWWIRLHPGMSTSDRKKTRQQLKALMKNNWDLDNASKMPLYSLLRKTNLHITAFSSSVIEAAKFGIPSILTDPHGTEYYAKYIANKEAFVALTLSDLLNTIETVKNLEREFKTTPSDPSQINNILKMIEGLIKKSPNSL